MDGGLGNQSFGSVRTTSSRQPLETSHTVPLQANGNPTDRAPVSVDKIGRLAPGICFPMLLQAEEFFFFIFIYI
ncbi:hypothetical protein NMG60_11034014 [Bertholletia excelsa]